MKSEILWAVGLLACVVATAWYVNSGLACYEHADHVMSGRWVTPEIDRVWHNEKEVRADLRGAGFEQFAMAAVCMLTGLGLVGMRVTGAWKARRKAEQWRNGLYDVIGDDRTF